MNGEMHFKTARMGKEICYFESIDSTNQYAKQIAQKGAPEGTLIVADKQTAGRGRSGRQWISPPGANIYFSLVLRPDYRPERAPLVTLVMGLAVAEAIRSLCGADAYIKWPNDVVIEGRKVCGILTEMNLQQGCIDYVVIGVGVNVGRQEFPKELCDTATDLEQACGMKISRKDLTEQILTAFEKHYDSFLQGEGLEGIADSYNALLINLNREVRVLDPKGEYCGIARGINLGGELIVELEDGTRECVYAGEVSVRGIYGYV